MTLYCWEHCLDLVLFTIRPGTFMESQAYQVQEGLLQVANGKLGKYRHNGCSNKGQDSYIATNGINEMKYEVFVSSKM